MPNNYIAGFDPVAMGLDKQWAVAPVGRSEQSDGTEGTQSGWSKSVGGGKTQQYDMQGNDKGITEDANHLEHLGKSVLGMAAIATGMGAFGGFGPLAGTFGTSAATSGAAKLGTTAATESFASSASAFGANAAPLSFEAIGGSMAVPEIAGVTAAEMGGVAAGLGGSSTLGTLTGAGYTAPTAGSLTSGMTAGGVTAGLGDAAAGVVAGVGEYGGVTGALSTFAGINPASIAANPGASNWFTSTFGETGVAGWIKANPELSKMLFATVGGAVAAIGASSIADKNNQAKIDVANITATNNLDVTKLKDQQTQDANKRYSASVSGINYGLINSTPKPLTRNDGTRVFGSTGLINRG